MALAYDNLTNEIKTIMLDEIQMDISNHCVYISPRLVDRMVCEYVHILERSILDSHGTDVEFERALRPLMKSVDSRGRKVPINAAQTLAEGEFNKYYVRAMCVYAILNNMQLEIVRVRHSCVPRPESENMVGTIVENLDEKLELLRRNDRDYLSIFGPNSGLSVKLVR